MRMTWVFVGVLGSLAGCDSGAEPLPSEAIGTTGTDDDDAAGPSSGTATDASTATSPTGVSATDPMAPTTPDPTDPSGTDGATDPSETGDPEDTSDTTGEPQDPCVGESANITGQGFVTASSVFDTLFGPAYEPELGVDGDVASSWFSAGPNIDGTASTFEWYTQFDNCIDEIGIISNAMHANPDFHEGFGFESVLIEVIDTSGDIVFEEEVALDGTPDPNIAVDPGGVLGNQVRLSLMGHESEDCGGFAELAVDGRAER